jgi:coenzyme F420 hydrogenase subunit beta
MKTFFHLIQEVQRPGLCHRCGGCVAFCTAVNYGALEMDEEGRPRYGAIEKCIECGLCYAICPEIHELDEETRLRFNHSEPIGRVMETAIVRSTDPVILSHATDGGAISALLLHLFHRNRIDGAIVTRKTGPFQRTPFLATNREEILDSAGFFFDTSHGMKHFSDLYLTHASIMEFDPMMKLKLQRVALVGTPCQIQAVRRMQVMGIVPSDAIQVCFGLFCSGNFVFGAEEREKLSAAHRFHWEDVRKINLRETFQLHLRQGETIQIDLEELQPYKRYACRFCADYSSEFADLSFGGIGSPEGFTTVLVRTPLGRAILADSREVGVIEDIDRTLYPVQTTEALNIVRKASGKKRVNAQHNRRDLRAKPVNILG